MLAAAGNRERSETRWWIFPGRSCWRRPTECSVLGWCPWTGWPWLCRRQASLSRWTQLHRPTCASSASSAHKQRQSVSRSVLWSVRKVYCGKIVGNKQSQLHFICPWVSQCDEKLTISVQNVFNVDEHVLSVFLYSWMVASITFCCRLPDINKAMLQLTDATKFISVLLKL